MRRRLRRIHDIAILNAFVNYCPNGFVKGVSLTPPEGIATLLKEETTNASWSSFDNTEGEWLRLV
jgi:hypothetical protein